MIYTITGFHGDAIFFDRSWTVVGDADWSNNLGPRGTSPFFVEFTQEDDTLLIQWTNDTIRVPNAQQVDSRVQLRYDIRAGR